MGRGQMIDNKHTIEIFFFLAREGNRRRKKNAFSTRAKKKNKIK